MQRKSALLGFIAGALSIYLWFLLNFANPYTNQAAIDGTMIVTLAMLVLPACLGIISFIFSKKVFMLIAFIWSFPLSLYLLATPGIFLLFGITSFTYLISYLLMRRGLFVRKNPN
jgi:uncharacterized protein YqhQ